MSDLPSIHKSRDHGELQDIYRRALAASWAASPGELSADQCVEDIFDGGDGWKDKTFLNTLPSHIHGEDSASDERSQYQHHHRSQSGTSIKSESTIKEKRGARHSHKHSSSRGSLSRTSVKDSQNDTSSENSSGRGKMGYKKVPELDEFDTRDDLMAWRLPSAVR